MRFTVIDPTTDAPLAGLVNVEANNASLGYGRPLKDEKDKADLTVGESSRYLFQTGAGKTYGNVLRTE